MAAELKTGQAGVLIQNTVQPNSHQRRRGVLLVASIAAAISAMAQRAGAQTAVPIGMTGWNVMDLYGVTPVAGASFVPFDDDFGYTWYPAGAPNPQGLPTANNRTFTSNSNSKTSFQLNP